MSLQSVVSKQLQQSGIRLSSLKNLASFLVEDVVITIERQGIEPLLQTESVFQLTTATVESAIIAETSDCNTFMNITSKHIKDKVFEIVGHSPDIVTDIIKALISAFTTVLNTALAPIINTLSNIVGFIKDGLKDLGNLISNLIIEGIKKIATFISGGFDLIGNAIIFVQSTVNSLLEDVAGAFDTFTLMLKLAFAELMSGFEVLLRITPEAMFNLQKELQNLIMQEQARFVKSQIGGE